MTGGYANRDFSLFFKIADNNKDKKFVCVVGSNFKTAKYNIPSNVTLFQDVPPPRFEEIMNESKVILVPLLDDDVAGLVVVKNAISHKIPFVASDIEAIRNYIPNQYWDMVLSPLEKPEIFEKKSLDIYKMCDKWDDVSNLIEIYAQKYAPVNRINEILRIFQEEGWIE